MLLSVGYWVWFPEVPQVNYLSLEDRLLHRDPFSNIDLHIGKLSRLSHQ